MLKYVEPRRVMEYGETGRVRNRLKYGKTGRVSKYVEISTHRVRKYAAVYIRV